MIQGVRTNTNLLGGTINLGIKEAKRRGLKGKELQAFKTHAWDAKKAEDERIAKELEKAKKRFARKQNKSK